MAQRIKFRRSSIAGRIPTTASLSLGELAFNTADGKVFFQRGDETIQTFFTTNALITGSLQLSGSIALTGSLQSTGKRILLDTAHPSPTASLVIGNPEQFDGLGVLAFGRNALASYTGSDDGSSVAFGDNALSHSILSPNDAFGVGALEFLGEDPDTTSAYTPNYNTGFGAYAGYRWQGYVGTWIGQFSGPYYNNAYGRYNIGIGALAMINMSGSKADRSEFNTGVGATALYNFKIGSRNTAIGYASLQNLQFGSTNTGIGPQSFNSLTGGTSNIAIGNIAARYLTTGSNNIIIGTQARQLTSGSNNTVVGSLNNLDLGNFDNNIILTNGSDVGYRFDGTETTVYSPLNIAGDLTVTGSAEVTGDLVVQGTVTAQEFKTEFVSASIIYQSGSTKFGDTSDDVHQFTGSLGILSGSLTLDGPAPLFYIKDSTLNTTHQLNSNNTELQIKGDQALELFANNISSIYVASDGDVGINTDAPSAKLDVAGDVKTTGNITVTKSSATVKAIETGGGDVRMTAGGTTGYIGTYNNNSLQLVQNGNTALFVDTSRNVGIGTNSPLQKLHVSGNFQQQGATNSIYMLGGGEIRGTSNLTLRSLGTFVAFQSAGSLFFQAADTERMRIDSATGNVGIRTTTPSKELTVEGDISASGDLSIRDFPSVSSSLASGGKITYDSASGADFDLTNIQVNDYDDNVAVNFVDGKLTFTFGTPEVPSSINSSLSGFATNRFNQVTDNYTINGTWSNGGYTLISASLYEGSTLLEEVGTGTSLSFNTTTSGSHTYRLEYTASSPLDGSIYATSDTVTGTLSKSDPTAPSISRTYNVQLRSGNNIEEGATGSIAFITSSGALNGWEYTGGSTSPSTSPVTVSATGNVTIQATANYQSPSGDNIPQLTRTKTSTATSSRIRSLRYGTSTATSFSESEIQDIDEWVNNIGTIVVGTTNPNNQQFTITTSAEYIYIIYDKNQSDLDGILNVNNSNSNDLGVYTKTEVGNYNVYRSNNLSTTSILYKLTT